MSGLNTENLPQLEKRSWNGDKDRCENDTESSPGCEITEIVTSTSYPLLAAIHAEVGCHSESNL
jgi:hypothetical protein